MLTQRFLNEIDGDKSCDVEAVRHEIWSAAEDFRRLMDAKDTSYKSKQLPELLDVYSRFHYLEYRALSGVLVTGVALVFVHYVIVSVLMQSS